MNDFVETKLNIKRKRKNPHSLTQSSGKGSFCKSIINSIKSSIFSITFDNRKRQQSLNIRFKLFNKKWKRQKLSFDLRTI